MYQGNIVSFSLNFFELFVVFLILKLTDVITWSWWWVWLPFIIHVVINVTTNIVINKHKNNQGERNYVKHKGY